MPTAKWTLSITPAAGGSATSKALDAWGLADVLLRRESFGVCLLTASSAIADVLSDPICAFGDAVVLTDYKGVIRFQGRRVRHRSVASGLAEDKYYVFADAWYDLNRRVFQQPWGAGATYSSHLLLNYNSSAARIATTGEQIEAVITYAAASGVAIQVGNINLPVEPPLREITDQPCSAVIVDQARYLPNALGWIDPSFTPPAFNVLLPADLDAVTLVSAGAKCSEIDIEPLDENRVPAVVILYEISNEVNGEQILAFSRDAYPVNATGREDNALVLTIPLQGYAATILRSTVVAADLDYTNLDWWKGQQKFSWLNDPNVSATVATFVINGEPVTSRTGVKNLSRYLVEGQIAPWMDVEAGGAVDWEQEEVRIIIDVQINAGLDTIDTDEIVGKGQRVLVLSIVSTDAPSGESNYSSVQSFEAGDPVPVGLALYQYNALSGLEYGGNIKVTESECSGAASVGQLLNLSGGLVAWTTMNARIQATEERIDTGETTITIGPTPVRSAVATLELMQANRSRRRWTATSTQADGVVTSGSGEVQLGQATPNTNSIGGPEISKYFAVKDSNRKVLLNAINMILSMTDGSAQQFVLDYANAAWLTAKAKETTYPGASSVKMREVFICIDGDGTWKCIGPFGAPYK